MKTQVERWQYIIDGGKLLNKITKAIVYISNGELVEDGGWPSSYALSNSEDWEPYIEPKPKKKITVWTLEKPIKSSFGGYTVNQIIVDEEYLKTYNGSYKKVPGSERVIEVDDE